MKDGAQSLGTLAGDVFDALRQARVHVAPTLEPREVGVVTAVATGIARVSGLPGVGAEELLRFAGDVYGIAFDIEEDQIGEMMSTIRAVLAEIWR